VGSTHSSADSPKNSGGSDEPTERATVVFRAQSKTRQATPEQLKRGMLTSRQHLAEQAELERQFEERQA
jgi:hypothetical protein